MAILYNLGKLDMYQWLYFLPQHASWHVAFLKGERDSACVGEVCHPEIVNPVQKDFYEALFLYLILPPMIAMQF